MVTSIKQDNTAFFFLMKNSLLFSFSDIIGDYFEYIDDDDDDDDDGDDDDVYDDDDDDT
ncbi:hypothetical protein Glove_469g35 [Diversispora epigaea]|uniref:Uncharacterized protein n=1 Tax=Diversispora epigaea TaxID=1348612 RepID=A0A397GQ80_9GLOM|nr:hypothetical protein Glove_469g35 [Diversispora epigaea]